MRFATTCILLLYFLTSWSDNWLFFNGKSDYSIVVAPEASESEKLAATELQYYLEKVGGVRLPLLSNPKTGDKHIYVGYNKWVAAITRSKSSKVAEAPDDTAESFIYKTIGSDLIIYGGRHRGSAYGVYSFLEQQLGVRWYSSDFTKVPRRKSFRLGRHDHAESPAFLYRHVLYYQMQHDFALNLHNKTNMHYGIMTESGKGRLDSFWGGHTFSELIPPSEYFAKHPEYFSLYEGRRVKDGQLCLSNPAVIKLLTTRMLRIVKENPGYIAYSLTQNDNQKNCQCSKCSAMESLYGAPSGLLIWAVNRVAKAVEEQLPGTKIVTFAYQYTRKVPHKIKPRHNVIVRLCDIECCFMHPIEGHKENASFMADLKGWAALTDHLYVFDYVTGFCQYVAPFPNFQVLSRNLQFFRRYGVVGVMEEGQYESDGGEFAELKQWVLARLLWNPDQDALALAREFITDYYGSAASYVQEYFNLYNALPRASTHAHFDVNHEASLFTDEFIEKGSSIIEKALNACRGDARLQRRVEHIQTQTDYLRMKRSPIKSAFDGTTRRINAIVRRDGIYLREGQKPNK